MPQFVILTHDWPSLHWDFMLEHDQVLWTWRLAAEPVAGARIAAERRPDHRLAYLEYEGPISRDRGNVTRWDKGEYRFSGNPAGELTVELFGRKIQGILMMETAEEKIWFNFTGEAQDA